MSLPKATNIRDVVLIKEKPLSGETEFDAGGGDDLVQTGFAAGGMTFRGGAGWDVLSLGGVHQDEVRVTVDGQGHLLLRPVGQPDAEPLRVAPDMEVVWFEASRSYVGFKTLLATAIPEPLPAPPAPLAVPTVTLRGTEARDIFRMDAKPSSPTVIEAGGGDDLVQTAIGFTGLTVKGGAGWDVVSVSGGVTSSDVVITVDGEGYLNLRAGGATSGASLRVSKDTEVVWFEKSREYVHFSTLLERARPEEATPPVVVPPVVTPPVVTPPVVVQPPPVVTPPLVGGFENGAAAIARGVPGEASPGQRDGLYNVPDGGGTVVRGTDGGDMFWSGGSKERHGGLGDDSYGVVAQQLHLVKERPGEGVDTVIVWDTATTRIPDNVENIRLTTDTDNPLYSAHVKFMGSAGGPSAIGNALANTMTGSKARNTLDGMAGNDVLTGGEGRDTFVFGRGYDRDVVTDFRPGEDVVRLVSGAKDWAAVRTHLKQGAEGATITLDDGSSLTLKGVQAAVLKASDFEFAPDPSRYRLTFGDDFRTLDLFDGRHGDGGRWRQGGGYGFGGESLPHQAFVTNGYQGMDVEPFSVKDGVLSIEATYRPDLEDRLDGREYVTGLLDTRETFAQLYGVFEARMRTDLHDGGWPAFWLLPTDGSWPPEIDVMEQLSSDARADGSTTMHQTGFNTVIDDAGGWHTYTVEWTPERIAWMVDGKVTNVAYGHNQHKPMYMLVNYALGGWGGDIEQPGVPGGSAGGIEVDYVKAWELKEGAGAAQTVRDGASRVTFSVGGGFNTAPIEDRFTYLAATTERSHIYDRQLDFRGYELEGGIYIGVDRARDSVTYKVENEADRVAGGQGLGILVQDGNGVDATLNGFAHLKVNSGGSRDVRLELLDNQNGQVDTGSGNDFVNATRVREILAGKGSTWSVSTGAGDDTILGWSGQTRGGMSVNAGAGNDTIRGSAGADTIRGGAGDDVMRGGASADRFMFTRGETGHDRIEDFAVWQDRLVLQGYRQGDVSARAVDGGLQLDLAGDQHIMLDGVAADQATRWEAFVTFA